MNKISSQVVCKQWVPQAVSVGLTRLPAISPGGFSPPGLFFSFSQTKLLVFSLKQALTFFKIHQSREYASHTSSFFCFYTSYEVTPSRLVDICPERTLLTMFSDGKNYISEKGKNVVHLFTHPKFDSILYPEDDIIKMPIANRYQMFAWQIIHYWEEKGLRKPLYKNREKAYGSALSDLVAVMRGEHPKVHTKLSSKEIMQAINHWELAAHNPMYAPYDKKTFKSLDIPRFIYSKWNDHSYLIEYLDPPRTLTKEANPKLTQLIKAHYSNQRWGELKDNTEMVDHYHFVNASNRVNKYLQENVARLRMGLSPKNPDRAAYGLVRCASNSKNWHKFQVAWLANDYTFSKFTTWLKDQGFITFSTKIAQISR